jgi:hypothetical protein
LHITPGTVGSATMSGTTVTFPITGGHVTVYKKALKGEIDHQGSGLSLSAGSTNVTVTNLVADAGSKWLLGGDVSVNGKLLAMKADLFTVDDSSLKPISVSGATARATGATVDLSVNGAQALDEAFHTQQLEELAAIGAAKLGTATLTLKVK